MKFFSMIKRTIAVTALSILVSHPTPAIAKEPFLDVSGHWAKQDILRLSSQGLVNGFQGKFSPENRVTRAQMATMLVNSLRLNDQAKMLSGVNSEFKDVTAAHWAAGAIIVAKENGLISGYEDNSFRPDSPIRRDELSAMLVRALKFIPDSGLSKADLSFIDNNAIPDWAVGELVLAKMLGLISGYEDGSFRPAKYTTRAEAAVLTNRLLGQQGQMYDFSGTIIEISTGPTLMTIDVQGQKETFLSLDEPIVYEGSTAIGLNRIVPGDKVLFNLNDDGRITLLERNNSLTLVNWSGGVKNTAGASALQGLGVLKLPESLPPGALKYQAVNKLSSPNFLLDVGEKDPLINPEESLEVTKKEMVASQFTKATGSDGKGQVIAIIDTGVDAGHPDLRQTTDGLTKVMDWVDFTSEGFIKTESSIQAINGIIPLANGNYKVGSIPSQSGNYHYGFWYEQESAKLDINLNQTNTDSFAVLLIDSEVAGIYDTVIVDTYGDKDFTNDKMLHLYRDNFDVGFFPKVQEKKFNFVVSKINSSGASVQLSFDGNDHGTHVAGIAAANGLLQGVAPGARIMAIKALDSNGYGDESSLVQAINYAAINGADVINLSIGFPSEDKAGKSTLAQLVNKVSKEYGVIFVAASGNSGPGLATLATPGDAASVISIGAYISPSMWKRDFGWRVDEDSLWFFSSIGPRRDGGFMPTLVAPGSVVSTVPTWEEKGYLFSEGTSMAAPHAAGAVALLLEQAQKTGLKVDPLLVKRSLELGARELTGFSPAEQGYGVVDLIGAWTHLQNLKRITNFTGLVYNRELDLGEGLFGQGFVPGELDFYLRSSSNKTINLELKSTHGWLKPQQAKLALPANKYRKAWVKYEIPNQPGIYSGRLQVDDPTTYGPDLEILNTIIKPNLLTEANNYYRSFNESLGAGQYRRYFFEVPEGAASLTTTLQFVYQDSGLPGRARIHLFNPKGEEINKNLLDFAGADLKQPKEQVRKVVNQPEPGVWEAIVYSSATLSEFGLSKSSYKFSFGLEGMVKPELPNESSNFIFGLLPQTLRSGLDGYITLQIRERSNKRPYQGVLEVNGLLYSVSNGRLTLLVKPYGIAYPLVVKSVLDNKNKQQLEYKINLPVTQ